MYYIQILFIIYLLLLDIIIQTKYINLKLFKNLFENFIFRIIILFYICYCSNISIVLLLMYSFLYTIILINKNYTLIK